MNKNDFIIRNEEEKDYRSTENLVRESFWNVYCPGAKEHFVLNRFRSDPDFIPELDFIMEKDGKTIGQTIFVKAHIDADDGRKIPVLTFGPICIAPEFKRMGYGKALLDYSMEKARDWGAGALLTTGNIDFYEKCGFAPAKIKGIKYADDPEADYFLFKELNDGFLNGITGTYSDPEGYFVCEKYPDEFEKYEANFPSKEKKKLPGQIFN